MQNHTHSFMVRYQRRDLGARVTLLLATTVLTSSFLVNTALAQKLPTCGSVAAGSAVITQPSATQLNVTQSSQSAVVNWQGFSVGQGSAVNFIQPNSSSAILNRVTGSTPSTIAGSITANGQVYLVNPNGIAITPSGTINAGGGFVASTLGISDSDFMSGNRTFTGNGASAGVSNNGTISVGRGGYVALIGGTVSNAGNIMVPLGKVGLGSGELVTLDFAGDGFLQVAMPTTAGGKGALIKNSGSIKADGGSVVISAATALGAARNAVNISGVVEARSIGGHSGAITIGGGEGGNVKVSGKLIATSRHAKGGDITVTGNNVRLRGATFDVSGKTGGGTVKIGGDLHGGGTLQQAGSVSMDATTTIRADATGQGGGGEVVLWSTGTTSVQGLITAMGGPNGGAGGMVETSGHSVDFTGLTVNASAPLGTPGTWLIDPTNLTIGATDAATINADLTAGTSVTLTTTSSSASSTPIGIGTTSSGNGDIIVNSALSWASSATLTLNSYDAIVINAGITNSNAGSGLTLIAGGTGGVSGSAAGTFTNSGTLTVNVNNAAGAGTLAGVISGVGTLSKGGAGTLTLTGANTYTGGTTLFSGKLVANVNATRSGISSGAASIFSGATLEMNNTNTTATTVAINNAISGAGTLNLNFNDTAVSNTTTPNISGITGQIVLSAPATTADKWNVSGFSGILPAAVTVESGTTLYSASSGNVTFAGGISLVGPGNSENRGAIRVDSGGTIGGNITLTGDATIASSTGGTISGAISAASAVTLTVGSAIATQTVNLTGNISNGAGAVSLASKANVTLSGANSYTGSTTVIAGTLDIGSSGSLGSSNYAGAISIASGATFDYSSSAAQILSGIISGAGALAKDTSAASTLTLTGANTYTGTTTVSAGTFTLSGSLNVGSGTATTIVSSGATLNGTGVITAARLSDSGAGTLNLTGANLIGTVATSGAVGSFTLDNAQSLATGPINSSGPIVLFANGANSDLVLNPGAVLTSSASGTAVTLAAGRNFVNSSGSNAISASSGRWLVFSTSPGADTFGNLNSGNTAIWNTAAGASVSAAGNRYVFAYQPTLTFTSTSDTKIYGQNDAAALATGFGVSGYSTGVSGAFLADSSTTAYSGAPAVTSSGSAVTATVAGGPYTVSIAQGTLSSATGYGFAFANTGQLTVTPASLSVTATNQSKVYGTTANLGTTGFTASGLLGSDSVSGVTLASTGSVATAGVNGGTPYALNASAAVGSGLSNYTIHYVAGGLTVIPAWLVVIDASAQNKVYDSTTAASVTGGSLWGVVNGDSVTLSSANANFASANVGTGINVTTDYTLRGAGAGNYTLIQPVRLSANITPAQASPPSLPQPPVSVPQPSVLGPQPPVLEPQPPVSGSQPPVLEPGPVASDVKPPLASPAKATDCAGGMGGSDDAFNSSGGGSSGGSSSGCRTNAAPKAASKPAGIIDFTLSKLNPSALSDAVAKQFAEMKYSKAALSAAVATKVVAGTSIAVTAGLAVWLLRGGALLSALLSSMPLWRQFDPLAIVLRPRRRNDKDDEISSHVERMFKDVSS